jgi:hypothetical protein
MLFESRVPVALCLDSLLRLLHLQYQQHIKPNMADEKTQTFEIPKTCKGGVVVNEGPDFHVEVQDVDVPQPGTFGGSITHYLILILVSRAVGCLD